MTVKLPSKGASSPPLHESRLLGWRSSLLTQHILPGLLATLRHGRLVLQHHGGHVSPAAVLAHQRCPRDVCGDGSLVPCTANMGFPLNVLLSLTQGQPPNGGPHAHSPVPTLWG